MSKRSRDAAAATEASVKRSRRDHSSKASASDSAAAAATQQHVTSKRKGRAIAAVAPADASAAANADAASSSALAAPASEPAADAAADADAEWVDPRLSQCVPFDQYSHLLQAYLGPHCLCLLLDRPPEAALGEDAMQTSEDPRRPKVLAPIVLRFVDAYFEDCLPPRGFFDRPAPQSSALDRRRKHLNAVQHCIHAILFNQPQSFESPVAFDEVVVYPVRRELPTGAADSADADGAGGSADFNLLYSNLAEELGVTFLETHTIVQAAPAAAKKKTKGSSRSGAAAAAAASAASALDRRVGVYYQFFVQIRPASGQAREANAAAQEQEEAAAMDLAVAPASPPPRRRRQSRSTKQEHGAGASKRGQSRAPPPPPSKRSVRALQDSSALQAVRELESAHPNAPVDLATLAAVVAIGPHQPHAAKLYPPSKPLQVLRKVVIRKKKSGHVKTEEGIKMEEAQAQERE